MDITLSTGIGGYFSYKIYRETPDNIIYESPQQKNLIVNSGLKHLYSFSIPDVMRVLDIGNSNEPARPSDTKLKGASFNNSNIFNDLLALYITGGPIEEESASEYTAFFRTKTTSSPTLLKEFVIKPGAGLDAFARQIFDTITLQGGDGIEFTYKVRVNWPCAPISSTMKLSYYKGIEGGTDIYTDEQLPLIWSPVSSSVDKKVWSNIYPGNDVIVAVASASTPGDGDNSNIIYSNDNGVTWLSASAPDSVSYNLNQPFNDVTYGFIVNNSGGFTHRYIAVGLKEVFYSETGSLWLSATPAQYNNWTGIAFGKPSRTVPVGSINTLPYTPLFVAVANTGANRLMTSSDSTSWSAVNSVVTNTPNWSSITYGADKFVAVADGGSHRIAYSTDGSTWLSAAAPALNEWQDVAYGNGLYVAVSKNATYSPIMYASGGDLSKWYPARSPYPASWRSVTYGDGLFVAVGEADFQPRAIYSVDGKNWNPVVSIPFDKVWNSVTYLNNTFVAIASSNTTMGYPFSRVESSPRTASVVDVNLSTALLNIPDRVFNPDYILYTLRDFNMPTSCKATSINASDLQYSTTYSFNSYAKAQSSLLSPNTAISSFSFNKTTGHGAIKNFLITDAPITSAGTLSGIWISELNVEDGDLSESVVYTGTESSIITLSPKSGSLTRNLSSNIGEITNSTFNINIIHTWLPSIDEETSLRLASEAESVVPGTSTPSVEDASTPSAGDKRPYADIVVPFWEVIDLNDYIAGGYYAGFIDSNSTVALYSTLLSYPNSIETCDQSVGLTINYPDLRIFNDVTFNAENIIENPRNPSLNKNRISQSGVNSIGLLKTSSEIKEYINTTTINPASADIISFINGSKVTGDAIKQGFDDYCKLIGVEPIVDQIVLTKNQGEIATTNPYVRRVNNSAPGAIIRIYFKDDPQIIKPDYVRSIASVPEEFLCSSVNGDQIGITQGTLFKEFYVVTP